MLDYLLNGSILYLGNLLLGIIILLLFSVLLICSRKMNITRVTKNEIEASKNKIEEIEKSDLKYAKGAVVFYWLKDSIIRFLSDTGMSFSVENSTFYHQTSSELPKYNYNGFQGAGPCTGTLGVVFTEYKHTKIDFKIYDTPEGILYQLDVLVYSVPVRFYQILTLENTLDIYILDKFVRNKLKEMLLEACPSGIKELKNESSND